MQLDAFLEEKGIGRAEFAQQIGVSEAALSRYINKRRIPEPEVMPKIAAATGGAVEPNDFYRTPITPHEDAHG